MAPLPAIGRKGGAVDSERFDSLVRVLATGISRRGALAGLAALTGPSLVDLDEAGAKKKRKKKKKKKTSTPSPPPPPRQSPPPPPRPVVQCVGFQDACPAGNCCPGLTCGRNDCDGGGAFCLRGVNGSCEGVCDCLGSLNCSERDDDTCQDCEFPDGGQCSTEAECCLTASLCSDNGCAIGNVCCQPEGADCAASCDCCAGFGCDQRGGSTCQACAREASAVRFLADQEECNVDGDCCRSDYFCEGSGCLNPLLDVCCGRPQASCEIDCDCCGASSNCPRAIAGETNACGVSGRCCQFAGGVCDDLCDCCEGLTCNGGACEPN